MSNLGLGAIVLVVSVIFFTLIVRGLLQVPWVGDLRSRGWPTVDGTIVGGNVQKMSGRGDPPYLGEISYSYNLDGQYYSGYYQRGFFDEQKGWDFVDGAKDRPVIIRYKASDPEITVLRMRDQPIGFRSGKTGGGN